MGEREGSDCSSFFDSEEEDQPSTACRDSWRRLPTAGIHYLLVECLAKWVAIASWAVLMIRSNTMSALPGHFKISQALQMYFAKLYYLGATQELDIVYTSISGSDVYWVEDNATQKVHTRCLHDSLMIQLPATTIKTADILWMIFAWLVPALLLILILHTFFALIAEGIWSFESVAYFIFTRNMYESNKMYRLLVGLVALTIIAWAVMWVVQVAMFDLWEHQGDALRSCVAPLGALVMSLKSIAVPHILGHKFNCVRPKHVGEFHIKRPLKDFSAGLLTSSNAVRGLHFVEALYRAGAGDFEVLKQYTYVDAKTGSEEDAMKECKRVMAIFGVSYKTSGELRCLAEGTDDFGS